MKLSIDKANEKFPMGSKVRYFPILGMPEFPEFIESVVRSESWDLCGSTVLKIKGKAGGVCVSHLELI